MTAYVSIRALVAAIHAAVSDKHFPQLNGTCDQPLSMKQKKQAFPPALLFTQQNV